MTQEELNVILDKHKKWRNNEEGGARAYFYEADLSGLYLSGRDLVWADLSWADLHRTDFRRAYLRWANLCGADFHGADLSGADFHGAVLFGSDLHTAYLCKANLCEADLDYSCWPLSCGSLDVKVDARIARQLAYHFCRLDCDDPEYLEARKAIAKFANGFHRVDECGRIEA